MSLFKFFKRKKSIKSFLPFTIIIYGSTFARIYKVSKIKTEYYFKGITGKYTLTLSKLDRPKKFTYFSSTLKDYELVAVLDKDLNLLFVDEDLVKACSKRFYTAFLDSKMIQYRDSSIEEFLLMFLNQEVLEEAKEVKFDLF